MLFKSLAVLGAASSVVNGLTLDVGSTQSIKDVSSTIAYNLMKSYYTGNKTGGSVLLPQPYYWWEAGAMYGGLVDYWGYTGDDTYNDNVGKAIVSQASDTVDFMLPDQRFDLGNDDQGFWALAAMSALEQSFPIPSGTPANEWELLTVNTFNDFVSRWNTTACAGGLKWQIYPENNGYTYKNTISNGAFFQLAARLARYTGNSTYSDWATKAYDWMSAVKFIDTDGKVYDGAGDANGANCTGVDHGEWSYNAAMLTYGAAVMWALPANANDTKWSAATKLLVGSATARFFGPYTNASGVMFEQNCETANKCNNDQYSFKAYLSRWLGKSVALHSELKETVQPLLEKSATAAAQSCVGAKCGTKWYVEGYDGLTGPGQMMSAMETVISLLAKDSKPPGTEKEPVKGMGGVSRRWAA